MHTVIDRVILAFGKYFVVRILLLHIFRVNSFHHQLFSVLGGVMANDRAKRLISFFAFVTTLFAA